MSSASTAFAENKTALVGYLPAGFPTKQAAIDAAIAMVQAGVDVFEVGLPYSDPLMDGPVIADAVHMSLTRSTKIADVLDTVAAISSTGTPTLIMTYWNPIDRYGVRNFARDLAKAGGAGLITPDLSPEEADPWLEASDDYDLDRVFLVAPSTTPQRLAAVTRNCRGFVYAASLMGITGTKAAVSKDAQALVQRTREHTGLPIAVGLGVSTAAQAAEVAAFADGVIVGTAFVRKLMDAPDPETGIANVKALATELATGIRTVYPARSASGPAVAVGVTRPGGPEGPPQPGDREARWRSPRPASTR